MTNFRLCSRPPVGTTGGNCLLKEVARHATAESRDAPAWSGRAHGYNLR